MVFRKSSLESVVVNKDFWTGKKVLITGHTGFKGSWLSLWMQHFSADIIGVSLDPPSQPNLFEEANIGEHMLHLHQDIRDLSALKKIFLEYKPEIVFHLAAQPLVIYSYYHPIETYSTNIMGTINILEAIREIGSVRAAVFITSDKCYENREQNQGYKESDPMGGSDPYSSSKGAAELLISAYRKSYFSEDRATSVASARAGNVIGGGDWAENRLIPDIMYAFERKQKIKIRNLNSVRPWQHVIEPIAGYMLLAESLYQKGPEYAEAWNFGPEEEDAKPVEWILEYIKNKKKTDQYWAIDNNEHPHETHYLKLDSSKSNQKLHWYPKWNLQKAIDKVLEWHQERNEGNDLKEITIKQINEYLRT